MKKSIQDKMLRTLICVTNMTEILSAIREMDSETRAALYKYAASELTMMPSNIGRIGDYYYVKLVKVVLSQHDNTEIIPNSSALICAINRGFSYDIVKSIIKHTKKIDAAVIIENGKNMELYKSILLRQFPKLKTNASVMLALELNKSTPMEIIHSKKNRSPVSLIMDLTPEEFESVTGYFSISKILTSKKVTEFLCKPENSKYLSYLMDDYKWNRGPVVHQAFENINDANMLNAFLSTIPVVTIIEYSTDTRYIRNAGLYTQMFIYSEDTLWKLKSIIMSRKSEFNDESTYNTIMNNISKWMAAKRDILAKEFGGRLYSLLSLRTNDAIEY